MIPALAILAVATLLGAPVFTALGGAALILFWGHDLPVQSVPLKLYSLTTNDLLPSIPIFTLAGYFLAEGGASKRLVIAAICPGNGCARSQVNNRDGLFRSTRNSRSEFSITKKEES